MAPRKWIKALLPDSIASPFSKLALRHALQLVRDVYGFALVQKAVVQLNFCFVTWKKHLVCFHQITANPCMVRAVKV